MKINEKEKLYLIFGASGFAIISIYLLFIGPAFKKSNTLDRNILKKANEIVEMKGIQDIFIAQQDAIKKIDKNMEDFKKGFKIITFLSETAKKVGIGNNITQMKPYELEGTELYKESAVELKVDGIKLNQLVDYLYKIENSNKIINIKKLKISPRKKEKEKLDVKIEVSTFELKNKKS